MSTIFCLLFFLAAVKINESFQDSIIELPNGKILGRNDRTFASTTYYAFEKIPYAAPPVGLLRFKAPQPVQNWTGTLNTTYLDVSCFQLQGNAISDSEDCLFLNVFTPQLPGDEQTELLPVMLYIHGGGFTIGSSMIYQPELFIDYGVILVTINYRLGPFGFLSTQDEVIPGNNGLKDQQLAIQWTHDNIHLFGGDPEKITIFGQSAGSASVSYQLLNQNSKGLFQGAILESGAALCPWTYQRNSRNLAFEMASILNSSLASSNNSEELLQFLQSIPAEELDAVAEEHFNKISNPWDTDVSQGTIWGPVIEVKNPDAFLTKKQYGLIKAGNFLKVPILMGFTSEENLVFNQDPEVLQSSLETWDQNLDLIVPNDMQIVDADEHAEMAKKIRDIYTEGKPFGGSLASGVRYSSDNSFTRPLIKYAELFSEYVETYFYQFSFVGELGNANIHYYDGADRVGHSAELSYLFCAKRSCDLSDYSEFDQETQRRLITLWTNFAKYQNPTPEVSELLQNITWPLVSIENGDFIYVDIDADLTIKNHPKAETYQKWIQLYESLNVTDFDTY